MVNMTYERISSRPRRAGETTTQPALPCDLPDTTHELEVPSLHFSDAVQTAFDIFAVLFWSFFGLVVALVVFAACFFLFGG